MFNRKQLDSWSYTCLHDGVGRDFSIDPLGEALGCERCSGFTRWMGRAKSRWACQYFRSGRKSECVQEGAVTFSKHHPVGFIRTWSLQNVHLFTSLCHLNWECKKPTWALYYANVQQSLDHVFMVCTNVDIRKKILTLSKIKMFLFPKLSKCTWHTNKQSMLAGSQRFEIIKGTSVCNTHQSWSTKCRIK